MVKGLTDMFDEGERKKALDSTKRNPDFNYNDNHVDGPTPKETEEEQRKADELHCLHYERYHRLKDRLNNAEFYSQNPVRMAEWLVKNTPYRRVHVPGRPDPIPFAAAIKLGYEDNIRGMFKTEKDFLGEKIEESKKYAFFKSASNN